jgi:integrase/uncharacterized coiled-coil protein SlyX
MKKFESEEKKVSWEDYLETACKNKATRKNYSWWLNQFFSFAETNLVEFIQSTKESPIDSRKAIVAYLNHLKGKGNSVSCLNSARYSIQSLLMYGRTREVLTKEEFDLVDFETIRKRVGIEKDDGIVKERMPSPLEIKQFFQLIDLRGRAAIQFMASSGARVGALEYFKWKHIEPVSTNKLKFAKITIYPGTKDEYYSFITPECFETLIQYRKQREFEGETITPESFVFARAKGHGNNDDSAVTSQALLMYFTERWKQLGLRGAGAKKKDNRVRFEFPIFHVWRKWFKTKCESSGMKTLYVEMLMGHNTGLNRNYFKANPKEMAEEYAKVARFLEIESTAVPEEVIEQKVDERMAEKDKKIDSLSENVAELTKQIAIMQDAMKLSKVLQEKPQVVEGADFKYESSERIAQEEDEEIKVLKGLQARRKPRVKSES